MQTNLLKGGQCVDPSRIRRLSRIRLQVPVLLRGIDWSGNEFMELTKTLNISATGACLASTRFLRAAQIVNLTFPAPSSVPCSVVPSETAPISAKVLRQGSAGEIRLIGLEFLKPLE